MAKKVKPIDASKLSPQLQKSASDLQWQVSTGGISQEAANAELNRQINEAKGATYADSNNAPSQLSNTLQKAQSDLQWQVQQGWITQDQANAELNRQKLGELQSAPNFNTGLSLNTPGEVLGTQFDLSKAGQIAGNTLTNPNQVNPFGSQTVTYDPVTGQPTLTQGLSGANQQVLGGVQGNAVSANDALNQLIQGTFGGLSNPNQPNSAYVNSIFSQLTEGLDQQKAKEKEALEQELANRGIPITSGGYKQRIKDLNDRYDQLFKSAKNQAVTTGINTGLSAVGALGAAGQSGFYNPSYQGFSPVSYNQANASDIFNILQQSQLGYAGLANAKDIAKINAAAQTKAASIAAEASKSKNTPEPPTGFNWS